MPPKKRVKAAPAKPKAVEEEIDDLEEDDVEEVPAPAKRIPATTKRKAKKPAPEPEVDEDDEDEDDEEETPAPAKKRRPAKKAKAAPVEDDDDDEAPAKAKRTPPKRAPIEFGTAWLAEHLEGKTGNTYTSYDLRVLLRKLAKNGVLDREVGVERARYEFSGPKDPVVIEIVKAVKSGAVEKSKKEALDKLKENSAAKKAAGAGPAKKKAKRAKPIVQEVEDDDLDDEDDEDVDELDD